MPEVVVLHPVNRRAAVCLAHSKSVAHHEGCPLFVTDDNGAVVNRRRAARERRGPGGAARVGGR